MCSFYAIFFKIKLPIINKSQSLFYITIKFYINTILHIPTFHILIFIFVLTFEVYLKIFHECIKILHTYIYYSL